MQSDRVRYNERKINNKRKRGEKWGAEFAQTLIAPLKEGVPRPWCAAPVGTRLWWVGGTCT